MPRIPVRKPVSASDETPMLKCPKNGMSLSPRAFTGKTAGKTCLTRHEAPYGLHTRRTSPHIERKPWCPGEDSNFHDLRHTDLNRARLPIPPPGQPMGAVP